MKKLLLIVILILFISGNVSAEELLSVDAGSNAFMDTTRIHLYSDDTVKIKAVFMDDFTFAYANRNEVQALLVKFIEWEKVADEYKVEKKVKELGQIKLTEKLNLVFTFKLHFLAELVVQRVGYNENDSLISESVTTISSDRIQIIIDLIGKLDSLKKELEALMEKRKGVDVDALFN